MSRRSARETALQALFQVDVGKVDMDLALSTALSINIDDFLSDVQEDILTFSRRLLETTCKNLTEIDGLIQRYSVGWTLERMGNVDRNILRLAVAELLFFEEIPEGVAINEAVELGKRYGDVHSSKFINGILGNVAKEVRGSGGDDGEKDGHG